MRLFTMFLLAILAASSVGAASYQMTDGTIVDPIMHQGLGSPHRFGGRLKPGANYTNVELSYANLFSADLHAVAIDDLRFFGGDAEPADMNTGYSQLSHTGGVMGLT